MFEFDIVKWKTLCIFVPIRKLNDSSWGDLVGGGGEAHEFESSAN